MRDDIALLIGIRISVGKKSKLDTEWRDDRSRLAGKEFSRDPT